MSWQDDAKEILDKVTPGSHYWPLDNIDGIHTGATFGKLCIAIVRDHFPFAKEACEEIINSNPNQSSLLFQELKNLATNFVLKH